MALKRTGAPVDYDIERGTDDDPEVLGDLILRCVGLKGFCTIKTHALGDLMASARQEVESLRSAKRTEAVPGMIMSGLLGEEGSVEIATLDFEDEACESWGKLNEGLSSYATLIAGARAATDFGFVLSQRTDGIVHFAGNLKEEPPEMTMDCVMKWLSTFVWHRLMLVLFVGPRQGTMELFPFDEGSNSYRLTVEPGTLLVLRADKMWHKFSSPGDDNYALSCFLQEGARAGNNVLVEPPVIPVAMQLDKWAMNQMEAIVEDPDEVDKLDSNWKYALEHTWHKGQQFAIRGTGTKIPTTWNPETEWLMCTSGTDVVTEVPYTRWDHNNYYSPDPEGWKYYKVCTRHTAMCDGMDLFDAKFFRISPAETKGMDPMQRQILEIGYASLAAAGRTVKNLLQSLTAVYVGCHLSEWPMVDQGPEETGGCEQRSAGTGQAGSIMSNRFSFVFGMNGPSVQFDTDASSSLAVLETGAVALDERKVNSTMSCCVGIAMVLTPLTWIHRCGLGQISPFGRAFSFDSCASGWVKEEGGGAIALDNLTEKIEGVNVVDESRYYLGTFGSVVLTHAGAAATLGTPHGPAEQELVLKACREARINPCSIDAVEAFADASLMGDAVEMASCKKALCDGLRPPLAITSIKSNMGNGIQGSGMCQIFKTLYGQAYGWQVPTIHLRQINPQVDDMEGVSFPDENTLFPTRVSQVAVNSIGWGGTLGGCVCSCGIDADRVPVPKPALEAEPLIFWPGGGGDEMAEPSRGFDIMGSWNGWEPEAMEKEGPGVYGFLVTLGANRFEEFQILYNGDEAKVLHPPTPCAPAGSAVDGPDENGNGGSWALDGRVYLYSLAEGSDMSNLPALPPLEGAPPGQPQPGTQEGYFESSSGIGDQYWVRLSIAGKWRVVTWEKVCSPDSIAEAIKDPTIQGKYYLTGNFNLWTFTEMVGDEASPGTYSTEVRLMKPGGKFQIVRNKDQSQIFHPTAPGATDGRQIVGPEPAESFMSWSLAGAAGDVFKVSFQRTFENGVEKKLVAMQKVRQERLSDVEQLQAKRTGFAIIGTWNKFKEAFPMSFNGTNYSYSFVIGSTGSESFQLLIGGSAYDRLVPSLPDASPHDNHELLQGSEGNSWTVGLHSTEDGIAGKTCEVSLLVTNEGRPRKVTWSILD